MKSGSLALSSLRNRSADGTEEETENLKSPVSNKANPDEEVKLKREMGLLSAIFLIVGTMIGSGIFISPKGVLERTGSVGASLLAWAGCGVIALFGALTYAELGTAIPMSGAEYAYYLKIYGDKGRFGAIPAFMYLWMCSLLIKPAAVAIMLLTFAEYIVTPFFPDCASPELAKKLLALVGVCFITFINCFSVKAATKMNNYFTVAKLGAIGIVVGVGIYRLCQGHYEHLQDGFKGTTSSVSDVATAFYFGLWAYDGWNNLNFVTEELINPHRNLPLAIMIGIPLVTICYVFTNIAYLTVLSPAELLASQAVAVNFSNRMLGPVAFIIPVLVAISAFGASNGTCLIVARLPFVAARKGHTAELMSFVQVKTMTPAPALIANCVIVILMIVAGNISGLIDFFSFVVWMFYGLSMVSVIMMRFTDKDLHRPYRVPILIPVLMIFVSLYLVLAPIIQNPSVEYLYALLFLLSGFIFYVPCIHYKLQIKGMKNLTHFVQLILDCAPQS